VPRGCLACSHAQRADLEFELLIGASATAVARRFGVGADSLRRHLASHLPDTVARSERFRAAWGDRLAEKLERHEAALVALLRAAAAGQSAGGAVSALRDLTRLYRAVQRVQRRFAHPAQTAQVPERPQSQEAAQRA